MNLSFLNISFRKLFLVCVYIYIYNSTKTLISQLNSPTNSIHFDRTINEGKRSGNKPQQGGENLTRNEGSFESRFLCFCQAPSSPAFGWAIDISLAARFLVYHPSSNTWRHIQRRESLESVGEGDAFQKRRSNRVWGCCLNLSPRSPMWPIASLFETCRHERERDTLPIPLPPQIPENAS